ncbi:MAG TPA: nucleotide exchange factor GrpE [Candidatus Nanopelagicaceae bacterium]|nr:nucleotide exchange factor GrpE [Candidatus Nanopelagicaceae bacterium]
MTRKKKGIEKMSKDSIKNGDIPSSNVENTESKDKVVNADKEKVEDQDVKLLEGEEQKVLEYHDLDDLIAKYNELKETNKKDKEALLKYQKESESWKNKHMRLQAEFENAQKRWNKTRQDLRTEYTGLALKSFLPLYDSFKKALERNDENNVILKQFYDQFISILKFHKAEPIEVKINDPFDYSYHEALSSLEKDDLPNNSIIEIIQDGWKMDKNVLRYTKVIISREPPPPKPGPEPEPEPEEETEVKDALEVTDKDTEIVNSEEEPKEEVEEPKEEQDKIENNNK